MTLLTRAWHQDYACGSVGCLRARRSAIGVGFDANKSARVHLGRSPKAKHGAAA
jgi:hypothetical protein